MNEYAEREELETFIADSAVPDGDRYVLRSGSIADTLWDAGYRKSATRIVALGSIGAMVERAEMHGNHVLYVHEVKEALEATK